MRLLETCVPGRVLANAAEPSGTASGRAFAATSRRAGRMEVCMKSILDPQFRYTSSSNTDIRKTFARVRREMKRQASTNPGQDASNAGKITPIFRNHRPAA
jgi:hypothetical protein